MEQRTRDVEGASTLVPYDRCECVTLEHARRFQRVPGSRHARGNEGPNSSETFEFLTAVLDRDGYLSERVTPGSFYLVRRGLSNRLFETNVWTLHEHNSNMSMRLFESETIAACDAPGRH